MTAFLAFIWGAIITVACVQANKAQPNPTNKRSHRLAVLLKASRAIR